MDLSSQREESGGSGSKRKTVLFVLDPEKIIQYRKYEYLQHLYCRAQNRDGPENSAF